MGLLSYAPVAPESGGSLWLAGSVAPVLGALACMWIVVWRLLGRWRRRLDVALRREEATVTELRRQVGQLSDQYSSLKVTEKALAGSLADSESAVSELHGQIEQLEALREELTRTHDEATQRDEAKSAFLVRIARELRTPLTAILGLAHSLIHEGDLQQAPPERVETIYTIRQKGEQLLALVNEIIELSEVESGVGVPSLTRCQLTELLGEVRGSMEVWADAKDVTLVMEYIGQLPETVETDATRVQRILLNVVGNAVKHTDSGGIRLLVRLTRGEQEQPQLQIDIVDTGIGMTNEQKARLFRPFAAVGSEHEYHLQGPGLGLTISKRYAQQLGGDLELVDTGPGLGTRFRLSFDVGDLEDVRMFEFGNPVSESSHPTAAQPVDCAAAADTAPGSLQV
ncbi:MAG: ATP-binding protein [Phycisphaerae bacterium]